MQNRTVGWLTRKLGSGLFSLIVLGILLLAFTSYSKSCTDTRPLTDYSALNRVEHSQHVVVAAHIEAARVGEAVLARGGNAMDAAVATQLALAVVEPHETGLAGGGFLLWYDAEQNTVTTFDGRESAPASAQPDDWLLYQLGNWQVSFPHVLNVIGARSVGVPGMPALLYQAHQAHGQLAWDELFAEALALTNRREPIANRLHGQLTNDLTLRLFGDFRDYFYAGWQPREYYPRERIRATLLAYQAEGAKVFYQGDLGAQIVERVSQRQWLASGMTLTDLANYQLGQAEPLCGSYRQWRICSMGAPSAGGMQLLQILGLLEPLPVADWRIDDVEFLHYFAQAGALALADAQYHVGDPVSMSLSTDQLVDSDYLQTRHEYLQVERRLRPMRPGIPAGDSWLQQAPPPQLSDEQGTSQLAVVDRQGNAVSMTGSIEAPFGARMISQGLLLNNQLTDFDAKPRNPLNSSVNTTGPGKRPRSSMTPTLIFNPAGELTYLLGSRGGARIPSYVAKTVIGVIDWELSLQQAMDLPNVVISEPHLELESERIHNHTEASLRSLGHRVKMRPLDSGLHGIERTAGGWRGAADSRMEGAAIGNQN